MAYATTAQLRRYLKQIPAGTEETVLTEILARASAVVDSYVGHDFDTSAAGTETLYGDGTDYLVPSRFVAGSVTAVTTISGYTVPDYIERDGALVVTRESLLGREYGEYSLYHQGVRYPLSAGWAKGVPYTVAATYGYASAPADIVEAVLEIAARIWRGRDSGFSNVIGVEGGGAVGYVSGLPPLVKTILDSYRVDRFPGVW